VKTYGTLHYDWERRKWVIETTPDVSMRLKRNFAKISKSSMGTHELSDTPENARDLEWFLIRYPLWVWPGIEEILRERSAEHRERQSVYEALLSGAAKPKAIKLAIKLRDYQKLAAAMMLNMSGLLLADDVGLGKTGAAIGMLADKRARPALVVTLTHLPKQWQAELARFAPGLRTHVLRSGKPYRIPGGVPDIIITSYSKLAKWGETLAAIGLKGVVFDEIQELRLPESAKYAAAAHVRRDCDYATGLTATPIYNQGSEIHSVMQIVRPDALGTREEFLREWCPASYQEGRERVSDPKALGLHMRELGLMLRRTRSEVGRELPPNTRVPHYISADLEALEKVSDSCRELARFILGQGKAPEQMAGKSAETQRMLASEQLSIRLRQATGIAKAPHVADFVRLLVESGEKVVVYAWHRAVYTILLDRLAELRPVMYTGSESANEKGAAKTRFCDGDAHVLLMSLRAGAGLDGLQRVCRTGVFAELDWSAGVHEQCEGRYFRDGQEHPVMSYYLLSEVGSDPIISDVLNIKAGQLAGIRDPNKAMIENLQSDPGRIRKLAEAYLQQIERREKKRT
jgi:SNF2 family DNA or RNA helicase